MIHELDRLTSSITLRDPDSEAYLKQKGVNFIDIEAISLPERIIPISTVDWIGESWQKFHGPLIYAVASGLDTKDGRIFPRVFPGPSIPGPQSSEQFIGSTSWDIFSHILSIPERVIDIDNIYHDGIREKYFYRGNPPATEVTPIAHPTKWMWNIPVPELQQMQLATSVETDPRETLAKASEIIPFLQSEVSGILTKENGVRQALELVQLVQSPFVVNEIPDQVVETATDILKSCPDAITNPEVLLPLVFQLESSLMYAYHISRREIIANGFYKQSWVDVARTPIEELHSTELVDPKRAIDEVVNLITRGWAPIITDERFNNTDGSHRGIAARVWSLLKHFNEGGELEDFIAKRSDMRGLTLRETLRITEELLTSPAYKTHRQIIKEAIPIYPDVKFIPTILLREQEACCVVKVPFDNEGKVIGVDPYVTFTLTNGRSDLALGSRGPYHRTDKTPAPWFNVFALQ